MDIEKIRAGIEVVLTENGQVLRNEEGLIYRLIVVKKETGEDEELKLDEDTKLELKDLDTGEESCLILTDDGWALIYDDPMTGQKAFSARGPYYQVESVLHPNWRLLLLEEARQRAMARKG